MLSYNNSKIRITIGVKVIRYNIIMGYKSLFELKQDSIYVGLTIFYLSALIFVFLKKNYNNNNNNIPITTTIKDDIKIEKVEIKNSNDNVKSLNVDKLEHESSSSSSPISSPILSPIKVIASGPINFDDNNDKDFMLLLKKGIAIQRIKDNKVKPKIMIINDSLKLSIKSVSNKYASNKERPLELMDSVVVNDQNGFSILFKEGRKVTKYDLDAESESERDFIVNGLKSLKEAENKNTSTILSSIGIADQ